MRLLIISLAIICFYSCGSSKETKVQTDTELSTMDRNKLEFIERRISAIKGELDSAKKAGGDSRTLETYSALIEFLKAEKAKINDKK